MCHVECSFDNTAENFFAKILKIFRSKSKDAKIMIFQKKISSKFHPGHEEVDLTILPKFFNQ